MAADVCYVIETDNDYISRLSGAVLNNALYVEMNKDMKEKEGMKNDVKKLGYEVEDLQVANASVEDRVATLETDAGECINLEFTGVAVAGSITRDAEGYAYYARNTTANWAIFDGFVKRGGTFKLYFLLSVGTDYATASQFKVNVGAITNGVSYIGRTNNLQNNVNFEPVMNANGTIGQHTEGTNLSISDGSRIGVILNHDVSDGVAGTGYVWGAYLVRQ